jgi:hypothetical protein
MILRLEKVEMRRVVSFGGFSCGIATLAEVSELPAHCSPSISFLF